MGRAYGWFEAGSCFVLEKIEVDRGSRSRGFGTAVIEQLRLKAREMGCRDFRIQGVRAANSRAIALYKSMGATAVETSPSLYAFVISPP